MDNENINGNGYGGKVARLREYFESGCLCFINGKYHSAPIELNEDLDSLWNYYNERCQCGRGYAMGVNL